MHHNWLHGWRGEAGDVDGDIYYGDLQKAGQTMMVMMKKSEMKIFK